MKNAEKAVMCVLALAVVVLSVLLAVSAGKLDSARGLCDQYRERIAAAEAANKQLADTVRECQSICADLDRSAGINIDTARRAVEVIEQLRVQVQELEDSLGGFSWDSYYEYWDKYLGLEAE